MNLQPLFATPLWSTTYDDADELNQKLLIEGESYDFMQDYFDLPGEGIAELKERITNELTSMVNELAWPISSLTFSGRQNPIAPGNNDTPHHHPDHELVGVYYVKVPSVSGDILLHDPRGSVPKFWEDPNAVTESEYRSARPYHRIEPVPGMLLFFPGYLIHSVEFNRSNDLRVSIILSINID